jgi:hypothetical protein
MGNKGRANESSKTGVMVSMTCHASLVLREARVNGRERTGVSRQRSRAPGTFRTEMESGAQHQNHCRCREPRDSAAQHAQSRARHAALFWFFGSARALRCGSGEARRLPGCGASTAPTAVRAFIA